MDNEISHVPKRKAASPEGSRVRRWLLSFWAPPAPEDDPVCSAQAKWAKEYPPAPDVPGSFVLDHARRVYDEASDNLRILDAKAGDILGRCVTLATILVAGLGAFGKTAGWPVIPSLICFLFSMGIASRCRSPHPRGGLPSIRRVVEEIPYAEKNHEARLAASLHWAVQESRTLREWKAGMVDAANLWLCLGAVGFLMPLVVWSIWR